MREGRWREDVLEAVGVLDEAIQEEIRNAERPDSLLSDIAQTQPWLRNKVRALRLQNRRLHDDVDALRHELAGHDGAEVDFADLRQRLAWILHGLRHGTALCAAGCSPPPLRRFGIDLGQES